MAEHATTSERAEFRVSVDESRGVPVVSVSGDADLYSAPMLRDCLTALFERGNDHVVVDLSATSFLDSMALGVLLGANKTVAARGGRLDVVVTTREVRRIFEIASLDSVLRIHPSRSAALEQRPARS